jgi:magnesium-transporting ATPase (P-type)
MFDDFFGLPFHPFILHATVVLVPGIATLALAFVALSSWRWLLRWPLALAAVFTPILTYVTVEAGESLKDQLGIESPLIETHQSRGETLMIYTLVFAVIALVAAFTMGGRSLLASGAGSRAGVARPLQIGVGVLLVVISLLVIVQVILTGDAGSRAVWSGT